MSEKNLGKIIKEARKNQNKTLKELAKEVGIDASTLQKYESGAIKTIPLEKLNKISMATSSASTILESVSSSIGGSIFMNLFSDLSLNVNTKNNDTLEILNKILKIFKSSEISQKEKNDIFFTIQEEFFKNKYK